MDIQKCYELLQERAKQGSNFVAETTENGTTELKVNIEYYTEEKISGYSTLGLISLFKEIQEDRVQTYRLFEDELSELITSNSLFKYPELCSAVTEKFTGLSLSVKSIKTLLDKRNCVELSGLIVQIQGKEKEKLTYIAARHLDLMHDALGTAMTSLTGGKSTQQQEYLQSKILSTEEAISEALESIHCIKCDLLESEEESA